jgi:hypothetical protein
MEKITLIGIFTGMALVMATGMVALAILGIALLILDIGDKLRIFWNHEILKHGNAPENPTKISLIRTPFFRIEEKMVDKDVAKIIGIDVNLGFKNSTNPIYVKFSKNVIQNFARGHIYDKYSLEAM